MASFEYLALNKKGRQKKGIIEGDSARQVRTRLREQGMVPVRLEDISAQQYKKLGRSVFFLKKRIRLSDLVLITRQLSVLIQSSIPLEESLRIVLEQSKNPRVRSILSSVRSKVSEGHTLSDSLADHPYIFDQLFCSMVFAGEKTGHLATSLERLTSYAEKNQKVRYKLQQAMIYPFALVVFTFGIVSFLLVNVVPKIIEPIIHVGQELPQSTDFLLKMSRFIQVWGIQFFILILICSFLTKRLLSKPDFRLNWDRKILFFPVIGKIHKDINTSRFARTLAMCISNTMPILEGMRVAVNVVSNRYMKKQMLIAVDNVREGASLSQALEKTKIFLPMMLHMISSGEQSGKLETMLIYAADIQDANFELTVNIVLEIVNPTLIALMAGLILFIVMATLTPMLEMNNLISG
ncbi:general secretion pathway protein F [Candidatus Photodesmus blepharus]|uniref:General secretion pathway protein F n=1 Tax=Candidatus Photodesmus blepharonis TaxID=1179155 RepID=A0A084CNJ8_9GAMM|nr:type II secretion system inner membrane protein GspF [Candidatus Photodesmus blepharus]KEY91377.1 general secretion pathway protein F [Candidatus Photodesmus blepharus]